MSNKQGKRLNPFQHVLHRPDTYIGSTKSITKEMWVYQEHEKKEEDEDEERDEEEDEKEDTPASNNGTFVLRPITYNQGLSRIFIEVSSNAIDNKWRSEQHNIVMRKIDYTFDNDPESETYGWITVTNDGSGIPVEKADYEYEDYRSGKTITESLYPAEVFFGEMLAGTNFEEDETRKTSGTNGMGAKAMVVFSKKAIVDHANSEQKKRFVQIYEENGTKRTTPKIASYSGKTYTKISFLPDYERFEYDGMDNDLFSYFKRFVYEAAMITGLPVTLNGERIVVKDLNKFARLFYPNVKENKMISFKAPNGDECVIMERGVPDVNELEEVPHLSWINGINTRDGGVHVDAWQNTIFPMLVRIFNARKPKKGEKTALKATAKQLYPYFVIFVRAEAPGPRFNGQTKDKMTKPEVNLVDKNNKKQKKDFMDYLDETVTKMLKWNFASLIEERLAMNAELSQNRKDGTKSRVADSKNYQKANLAGGKDSWKCTLFITEGLSAKAFADRLVSSIENGTEYYGSFAIRGKFINAQKFPLSVINKNKEVIYLKKVLGLVTGEKYDSIEKLRYGKVCFMTDQDDDGLHIRGLLLNFFWYLWPSLFDLVCEDGSPFLMFESFTTMVTMARWGVGKNAQMKMFYSNPEFHEWVEREGQYIKGLKVKYYKGLGTHVPGDELLYLNDQKMLKYTLDGNEPEYMSLGFGGGEGKSDSRKLWITKDMKKPGEICLNEDEKILESMIVDGEISLSTFVDKQLIIYHRMALRRALPSLYDGFKEAQRKIFYGVMQDPDAKKAPVVVETLAGAVKRTTGYHHGGNSLEDTMIGMAQGFVGSNNIPLLSNGGEMGCVDPETDILLFSGKIKKAKEIGIDDVLVGDDGKERFISKVVKGRDKMYKVTQLYGEPYRVNSKHILTLFYPNHKKIYWKEAAKSWRFEYFDDSTKSIKSKMVATNNGSTRYNSAVLSKEEGLIEIEKLAATISNEKVIDIDVQSYLKLSKTNKPLLYAAENRSVVQWEKKEVAIDPYVLGMWLGDGRANGRGFASADSDLVKKWVVWSDTIGVEVVHYVNPEGREGYQYGLRRRGTCMNNRHKDMIAVGHVDHSSKTCIGCQTSDKKHPACDWVYEEKSNVANRIYDGKTVDGKKRNDFNSFKLLLQKYDLVENKHIPDDYIFNDEKTRLCILAGIIDTDGTKRDNSFEISQEESSHGHMIDSIQFIARSLGFRAVVATYVSRRPNGGISNMKTVRISGDIGKIPTLLARKKMVVNEKKRKYYSSIGIEEDGEGDYVGWYIDGNERFLLGDFTITHNTRLEMGKDAAAARYPETQLEDISYSIFSNLDSPILESMEENGKPMEPRVMMPVIPMVLVNGPKGVASGFSENIPNYNPLDLVAWEEAWLEDEDSVSTLPTLVPYYRGFTGTIELLTRSGKTGSYELWDPETSEGKPKAWRSRGILREGTKGWYHIDETAIGVSTNKVKEHLSYLETGTLPEGAKKKKKSEEKRSYLLDVRWKGTTNTAKWDIKPAKDFIPDMDVVGNLKILQAVESLTNIYVIDENDYPIKYDSPESLLLDFCPKRLEYYDKRRDYWLEEFAKQHAKESDRYKFVKAVVDKKLNMYQDDEKLEAAMYKLGLRKIEGEKKDAEGNHTESFEYLLSMQMRSMTVKRLEDIKNEVAKIQAKIDELEAKSAKDLWREDLAKFKVAYAKFLKTRIEESDSTKKIKMNK